MTLENLRTPNDPIVLMNAPATTRVEAKGKKGEHPMKHVNHSLSRLAIRLAVIVGAALVGTLAWSAAPQVAAAQALVIVKVREAGDKTPDGKVTLQSKDQKATYSCQTSGGTCKISNVAGGIHVVTFEPKTGKPSKPRNVMIPPQGKVTLLVAPGRDD